MPSPAGSTGKVGTSGGQATYTLTFSNTGQSNLDDPVLYDLFPHLGDTEATSTTARDSQFAVELLSVAPLPRASPCSTRPRRTRAVPRCSR